MLKSIHFYRKGKKVYLSLNDDCSYNSLFLSQYWCGKLSCLPVSMCILDFWVFFFLHTTEASHWLRKWEPRWLIPGAIPCADLLQQLESVCLSFPIFPSVRAGWCPQVPPWPARHIPLLASLSSPQTPVGTSGLSGGAICGCWQWARSPQVKIKYDDYPARFPTPPSCRLAKLPYELK